MYYPSLQHAISQKNIQYCNHHQSPICVYRIKTYCRICTNCLYVLNPRSFGKSVPHIYTLTPHHDLYTPLQLIKAVRSLSLKTLLTLLFVLKTSCAPNNFSIFKILYVRGKVDIIGQKTVVAYRLVWFIGSLLCYFLCFMYCI